MEEKKPLNLDFKPIKDESSNTYGHHIRKNSIHIASFYPTPTNNCQTYCIASVNAIMQYPEWLDILVEIQKKSTKYQLLLDVKQTSSAYTKLVEYFKDDFVINQNYVSSNGSNMCMMLIKTTKLRAIIDKPLISQF